MAARFFDSLPEDELTPMEHALRKALLRACGTTPGPFPLTEWIDRRIGGEVETRKDHTGAIEIFLRGGGGGGAAATTSAAPPAKAQDIEAFFDALPQDAFAPGEEALRDAVFEFLATWRSQELATLNHLSSFPKVLHLKSVFLPRTVPLKDWIEHRIGGEIEFRGDGRNGSEVVHLTDAARATVVAKYQQMVAMAAPLGPTVFPHGGRLPPPPVQTPDRPPLVGMQAHGPPAANKEAWFASLPPDELLPGELSLREAILNWLRRWPQLRPSGRAAGSHPLISDTGHDAEIRRYKSELLPQKVRLGDWIERRIGGEVELRDSGGGQQEVLLRGAAGPPSATSGGPRQSEAPPRATEEQKEAFFAGLPEDEFSAEEEALRSALLDFLEQWNADPKRQNPPYLSDAGSEEQVSKARKVLLPKGCPVSLREWIDRRIGGEVETRAGVNSQVIFGLRGTLGAATGPPPAAGGGGGGAAAKRRRM